MRPGRGPDKIQPVTTKSCAICGKPVSPRAENRFHPFCSARCQLVDLGKWLGEEYRIPEGRLSDGAAEPERPGDEEEDA